VSGEGRSGRATRVAGAPRSARGASRARSGCAVVAAAIAFALLAVPALAAGPSRSLAQRYAHRTYVVDPTLGRRTFHLDTPRFAVRATDGSTITAFGAVLDSADGTGQIVLLFRDGRFLGWASAYDTLHLAVRSSAGAIAVTYGVYRGNDPFCCPSSKKTIRYRWNGSRIVADGTPPLVFGRRGNRLHLAPAH
jgi:LppP/LprE lipoprotein